MKRMAIGIVSALIIVAGLVYFVFPNLLVDAAIGWERRAAGLSKKIIQVGDDTMAFLDGGQGETVLCLHGFGANKDNWPRMAKSLTGSYRVVAPDLPGFGESSQNWEKTYGADDQVKRLHGFVEQLGLKRFHLVGNSMGGLISARYTLAHPDRVVTLGLFNAAGVTSPEPSELQKLIKQGRNALLVRSPEDFAALMDFVFVDPPPVPGSILRHLAREAMSHRPFNEKVLKDLIGDHRGLEPDLPQIKAPTLILWGDRDRVIHVSATKVLAAGLPNSFTVILKDCGHLPMIERPEETAGHYLDFIKRSGTKR